MTCLGLAKLVQKSQVQKYDFQIERNETHFPMTLRIPIIRYCMSDYVLGFQLTYFLKNMQ